MVAHWTASGEKVRPYGHREVALSLSRYAKDGRPCLRLLAVENERETAPCAVCTVDLPNVPMAENEVAIKTWHENVGMLGWLMDQGIVSPPLHYAYFAGVFIPICSLLKGNDDPS
jgi:hypothetical protein